MTKGKYLGIDFGDRRVGVAVSDFDKRLAFPREDIGYKGLSGLIKVLAVLAKEENVTRIVLGLPIEMDGAMGERVKKTIVFAEKLKKALPDTDLAFFDERLTTRHAARLLHEHGINAKDQKKAIDSTSAHLILQAYLDSLKTRG